MIFFGLLALPFAYVAALIYLFVGRKREGLLVSLVAAAATVAVGLWAIFQSRSSTAAIGIVFLPLWGAASGVLGILFGRLREASVMPVRVAGYLCLAGALSIPALLLADGRKRAETEVVRDAEQRARSKRLAAFQWEVKEMLGATGERGPDSLNALLRARRADREFVLAAVGQPVIDSLLLDTIARTSDIGLQLEVLRNPATTAATIERVFRTTEAPFYFFDQLARTAKTPEAILRQIRGVQPAVIAGLDRSFAANPALPRDMLDSLARTSTDPYALRVLLTHPQLDCQLATLLAQRTGVVKRQNDPTYAANAADARSERCASR